MSEEGHKPEIDFSAVKVIRQLSIPTWARVFALTVTVATFVGSVWLMGMGTILCSRECNDKLPELGVSILGGTFVPMVVLIYIAFARTGIEALKKKSDEFLLETIPAIFNRPIVPWSDDIENEITSCTITASRPKQVISIYEKFWRGVRNKGYVGSSSERYAATVIWGKKENADIQFFIDLNLYKINVGILLPIDKISNQDRAKQAREFLSELFGSVFEGAEHEGYKIDENITESNKYYFIVARLKVADDFIWDPSRQLHFVQDLKNYILAIANCWCNYIYKKSE